ncbi:MAG: pre-peptidase C-terminal domain-containing protein [Acidobacteria bacterium]|nr:pre-peptidase C-terminal domain-containing protein [Acidobacteriota bacterium]
MKSVRFGGTPARGSVVRLLALAVACALVAAAVVGLLPGASAQQKSGAGSKLPGSFTGASKGSPVAGSREKSRASGAKAFSTPDGVSPLVLGCPTPPVQLTTFPQTVNSTLSSGDCTLPDGSFFEAYTFQGTAGQQIVITMKSLNYDPNNAATLDPYLFLMRPGETTISNDPNVTIQDDDGGGLPNARIPSADSPGFTGTLPTTGTYTIIANSFDAGETGPYTLSLAGPCAPQQVAITPVAGSPVTTSGTLTNNDCTLDDGSFYDVFTFQGTAGQQVAIAMNSTAFNPFLFLVGPDGDELFRDDTNAPHAASTRLPPGSGFVRLPQTGTYRIIANSFSAGATGNYTVVLDLSTTNCPSSPITVGTPVSGSLATTDCKLPADASFIDVYTFSGTAGQAISISMTSSAFDTYLFLLTPGGSVLDADDNGGGGTNARIPAGSGTLTLSSSGTYTIYANSAAAGQTGAYTLTLTGTQTCTYSLPTASRTVTGSGGTFTNNFTTQAGCAAPTVTSNSAFITGTSATVDAAGNGTFNYTVQANALTSPRSGTLTVGSQTFTVTQDAASCDVAIYPPVQPFTQGGGTGRFTVFPAGACSWTPSTSTPWITITSPTGATTGTGRVRYTVAPNTTSATRTGSIVVGTRTYIVTQTSTATTPQVQFSNATYSVNENDASKSITVTVSRIGDVAGAATIEYRTIDDPAIVPCDPNDPNAVPQRGKAFARCDYSTNLDTLTFDIGQTVKTFTIPLINDTHVEGNETFQIALQNPQGAAAGSQQTATVTIVDDDTAQSNTNPINQTPLFIRMQYLDFLSREPEGGEPWSAVINGCPNPFNTNNADTASTNCDRIKVSAAFFGSDEFKVKGFFVFLYYKVSFGAQSNPNYVPQYDEIAPDMRRITGVSTEERIDKTFNFAEDWVTRTAFVNRYGSKTNAQFVDELLANVGASLTSPDPVSGETRNSLVAALDSVTKTRAQVLRIIVESREVNDLQLNPAFVAMQYYGYLRRTPDPGGYVAWLNTINPPVSANPRDMVRGFLYADEYFLRFGPNVRQ